MLRQNRSGACGFGGRFPARVLLAELLDAPLGVHYLLLAGVKRMALRAHFDVEIAAHGRARVPRVAAAAGNGDRAVFGMDLRFHAASKPMVSDRKGRIIHNPATAGKHLTEPPGAPSAEPRRAPAPR